MYPPHAEPAIRAELSVKSRSLLRRLTLLEEVDSTNLHLQRLEVRERHGHVVLTERQTAGRGRRGKEWHSPPGGNIYLSLGWGYRGEALSLARLPLAVSVIVCRALQRVGVRNAAIKWPNDILADGRKLAGILVETRSGRAGQWLAVIGIGVNVRMPEQALNPVDIDQPWTDVCSHLDQPADAGFRDRLCGVLLDELLPGMEQFSSDGFSTFEEGWNTLDLLRGREVTVSVGPGFLSGTALGIGENGGLLLDCHAAGGEQDVREILAGEASVRCG